jgi:hypothetical protein
MTCKPIFFIVKSGNADWFVDADWPDGTIERVAIYKTEAEALDWLRTQSHKWLEGRDTDFRGASQTGLQGMTRHF